MHLLRSRELTSEAFFRPSLPIIKIYAQEIGRIEAEPQAAADTVPNAFSGLIPITG